MIAPDGLVAAALAGVGVALLVPVRPEGYPTRGWSAVVLGAGGGATVLAAVRPDRVVPTLVLVAAVIGVLLLRGRRRAAMRAAGRAARVQEACEVMAGSSRQVCRPHGSSLPLRRRARSWTGWWRRTAWAARSRMRCARRPRCRVPVTWPWWPLPGR